MKYNDKYMGRYLLLLLVLLVACKGEPDSEVTVEEYVVETDEAAAIPKEMYERETALLQDNITYTIDSYDERLRLMEQEVLSQIGSERSELEEMNTRLRLSLDTLKRATQYPNGVIPDSEVEQQNIQRLLEQLANEIRDL